VKPLKADSKRTFSYVCSGPTSDIPGRRSDVRFAAKKGLVAHPLPRVFKYRGHSANEENKFLPFIFLNPWSPERNGLSQSDLYKPSGLVAGCAADIFDNHGTRADGNYAKIGCVELFGSS